MPFPEVLRAETREDVENSLKSPRGIALKEHWKSLCSLSSLPVVHRGLSLSDAAPSLLLPRVVPKDILENGSTFLSRADIQHNALQWGVSPLVNNYVYVFLENVGPVFKILLSELTFVGPSFTEFHRGGFLGIPFGLTFLKFTLSKPLGEVLGPITLGIASGIADSEAILSLVTFPVTDTVLRGLSRRGSGTFSSGTASSESSAAPVARVRCEPSFHWGTKRCRGTIGPPFSRAHERCRRTAGLASPSP